MKHKNRYNGYTLIEVILAIVIFVVIMTAGLSLFSYGRSDINLSGHYRQAKELAEQKLEELKKQVLYDDLANENEDITIEGITFNRITTITEEFEDEELYELEGLLKTLEVEVLWTEKGHQQKVTLKTIISQRTEEDYGG